jgi:outer membrane protein assembly factor BamB
VTVLASLVGMRAAGGVLLAAMEAPGVHGDQTVALDQRTGAVLWHSADILAAVVPQDGRALLASLYLAFADANLDTMVASDRLGFRVAAVGLRDGLTAWTYALGPGCRYAVEPDPGAGARLAALCTGPTTATGPGAGATTAAELRTVDLSTGSAERSTALTLPVVRAPAPGQAPAFTAPMEPVVSVVRGRVLVGVPHADGAQLTAYDPDTLRPLWTHPMTDNDYGATPCADALCLSDGSGLAVMDTGTGAVRWRTAERGYTAPPGSLAGRLLVAPLGGARAMLVDVDTGRPVLDLSGWRAESADTGATPVFARWQRPPDGRVLFATVTGDPLAVRLIGSARDVLQDACLTDGPYLVCQTLDGSLRLWRYQL